MSIYKYYLFSFTLFFYVFGVFGEDDYAYLLKSMSWKKIQRSISFENPNSDSASYTLFRYYEEHGEKEATRYKLLYYTLFGNFPIDFKKTELTNLFEYNLKDSKTLHRISFYRLINELRKNKLISIEDRINLYQKFPLENDPICMNAYSEFLKILYDTNDFLILTKKVESLSSDDRKAILNSESMLLIAKSYFKLGKTDEGKKFILKLFSMKHIGSEPKKRATLVLKENIGDSFSKYTIEDLLTIVNYLPSKDQKEIYKEKLIHSTTQVTNSTLFKNACIFFLNNSVPYLLPFLKNHSSFANKEEDLLIQLAENLLNKNEISLTEELLKTYLKNSTHSTIYKLKYRISKKNSGFDKTFANLLEYLKQNPYDLRTYDTLIDTLANTDKESISYLTDEYWVRAIDTLPNLAVKGRLVYWYLRYLRYKQDKDKLNLVLSNYYSYCPGSYYIIVINEEFEKEIKSLPQVENPLSSKENLYKYISSKSFVEYAKYLSGQNISFAYFKDSYEVGQKLNTTKSKAESNKQLNSAVEYLKLGEFDKASILIEDYSEKNKLSDIERYEVYVACGDLSKNHYLSLYYTRQIMKFYKIPDDPLLLPYSITSRLYPRPHKELVAENSKLFEVDENIIYAIMRQESFFRENAISPSNARGLMQVMPSTGKLIAKKLNITNYSLHDPEVSIKFGAKFLGDLLGSYSSLKWASIAYNGGPGNLRKWKRKHYRNDFNHFLEELPSKESRDYCRIIISNYMNYKVIQLLDKS
jgi:hypothetical protein